MFVPSTVALATGARANRRSGCIFNLPYGKLSSVEVLKPGKQRLFALTMNMRTYSIVMTDQIHIFWCANKNFSIEALATWHCMGGHSWAKVKLTNHDRGIEINAAKVVQMLSKEQARILCP